jgi:hypothetical protein
VPLPKRIRTRRRHLLHVVAWRGKLASSVVRRRGVGLARAERGLPWTCINTPADFPNNPCRSTYSLFLPSICDTVFGIASADTKCEAVRPQVFRHCVNRVGSPALLIASSVTVRAARKSTHSFLFAAGFYRADHFTRTIANGSEAIRNFFHLRLIRAARGTILYMRTQLFLYADIARSRLEGRPRCGH